MRIFLIIRYKTIHIHARISQQSALFVVIRRGKQYSPRCVSIKYSHEKIFAARFARRIMAALCIDTVTVFPNRRPNIATKLMQHSLHSGCLL